MNQIEILKIEIKLKGKTAIIFNMELIICEIKFKVIKAINLK